VRGVLFYKTQELVDFLPPPLVCLTSPSHPTIDTPRSTNISPINTTPHSIMTVSQIPTHGEIQALLSTSAYDPAIVSKLEAYVRAQVSSVASSLESDAQYSFEANRTLVKLYQFFPHLEGELGMTVTALAAFLALLQFPETDFMALGCLIPERVQSMEPCATLVRYEFWYCCNAVVVWIILLCLYTCF
jgi:hypothetical protein